MQSSEVAARCRGVVQIYRPASGEVHALRGIDAEFRSNELTAVVGPSGSGKSTLMRVLSLLERPTAGELMVAGFDPVTLSPRRVRLVRRRSFGLVAQRATHNLFPHLSVLDHVVLACRWRAAPASSVREAIDAVGLGHRVDAFPAQLSGGEQQRLSVAVATVGSPRVIFADEPTAELDPAHAGEIISLLRSSAALGAAVIVNTHDPAVAAAADRVLALHHGTLQTERLQSTTVAVIDSVGRVQLPPDLLTRFPDLRAEVSVDGDRVILRPPSAASPSERADD